MQTAIISDLVDHQFRPGDTINMVLRYYNKNMIGKEQVEYLQAVFNVINNNTVPRVGETLRIPLYTEAFLANPFNPNIEYKASSFDCHKYQAVDVVPQ